MTALKAKIKGGKYHDSDSKSHEVMLCPSCGTCPEVAVYDEEVRIGEEGNLVRLKREEWNEMVSKVQSGELKKV